MLSELFSTCLTTVAAKSSSRVSEELLVWLNKCGRCSSCGLPSDGTIGELWSPGAFSDLILEEGEEVEAEEDAEEVEAERPAKTEAEFVYSWSSRNIHHLYFREYTQ